jgi:tetratricopeptide (TPR) repeat protein
VAERKDVLSTLFWMLTLAAYHYYCQKPGALRYACVLLTLSLGLMAKPMLVTLPFVLLLLDYWPLGRVRRADRRRLAALALEKVPLLFVAAASCVITVIAQRRGEAVASLQDYPFPGRLANAAVAYVSYLFQAIWPRDLAVYYPYEHLAWWDGRVWGSYLFLGSVSVVAVWQAGRRPYLLVGWLWYLGTLVPVIGLVQVGGQARADRYTYVPLIGVFLMAAWSLSELARRGRLACRLTVAGGAATLVSCAALTLLQVGYWHDSVTLWSHALAVTGPNNTVHNHLAFAFRDARQIPRAVEEFRRALALDPRDLYSRMNLGWCLFMLRRFGEARAEFLTVLAADPENFNAHFQLGAIAGLEGRTVEAIARYQEALRLRPEDPTARVNLAIELVKQGHRADARRHLTEAERITPALRQRPEFQAALRAAAEPPQSP